MFSNFVVKHPWFIIIIVLIISSICIIVPLFMSNIGFPKFQDPDMGFTTRGTKISNRLVTWTNLEKALAKPNGPFQINPKLNQQRNIFQQKPMLKKNQKKIVKKSRKKLVPTTPIPTTVPIPVATIPPPPTTTDNEIYGNIVYYSNETAKVNADKTEDNRWDSIMAYTKRSVEDRTQKPREKPKPVRPRPGFCGPPDVSYSQLVVRRKNGKNLLNAETMRSLCRLEEMVINTKNYSDLCMQQVGTQSCCPPWSLARYVAALNDHKSCSEITDDDVTKTYELLHICSPYFHHKRLSRHCADTTKCDAPDQCKRLDAAFNIQNFLTPVYFLPDELVTGSDKMYETMIFLPIACSVATFPLYRELVNGKMKFEDLEIVGLNFGLKDALFDEYLVSDTRLMVFGMIFIFFCIWMYTTSFFLTCSTVVAIFFSMVISYFFYKVVFRIKFFPFMNLLAVIVAIGIGSDDAFIFCKIWQIQKMDESRPINKLMQDTFAHAFFSMFVTTLTTSVAFLASWVSNVTAISCFSIFAGTAVLANYILMMSWFPACVIIWEVKFDTYFPYLKNCIKLPTRLLTLIQKFPKFPRLARFWKEKDDLLLKLVIKFRKFWITLFLCIAIASAYIVLYYPKLKLPSTPEFQLFDSSHPFEKYDLKYKSKFWFTLEEKSFEDSDMFGSYKLPLRFVWGVLPVDNGNPLDPEDLGTLTMDETFDVSAPESQEWLVNFCRKLKEQPFYNPTSHTSPLKTNCFIEGFVKSMQRKCNNDFTYENIAPCCNTSAFPFKKKVFNKCVIEDMFEVYSTPQFVGPGIAGPKFSTAEYPTIKTIVIEFSSTHDFSLSYAKMHDFYSLVESWMQRELRSAPKGLRNGWFVSYLDFYDLQRELSESTLNAIAMSMGLAFIVLLMSTLNVLTSMYAILTITCSIFVVMAVLVWCGWTLNVLESVAVSTAIGLTIDFSLHYTVNYKTCPANIAQNRVLATKHALSYMAGPSFMAALTTGAAGAFMFPSMILPYIQIGMFLVIVMVVSWLYATFFLGALLATFGPENQFGQINIRNLLCFRRQPEQEPPVEAINIEEEHEMSLMTSQAGPSTICSLRLEPMSMPRSSTSNISKYVFPDSPSTISEITIDDN